MKEIIILESSMVKEFTHQRMVHFSKGTSKMGKDMVLDISNMSMEGHIKESLQLDGEVAMGGHMIIVMI